MIVLQVVSITQGADGGGGVGHVKGRRARGSGERGVEFG